MTLSLAARAGAIYTAPAEPRAVESRARRQAAAESSLDTRINRGFAIAIGLALPVVTLTTQYIGTPTDLHHRVVPVDLMVVAFLAVLFFRHRMAAPPWPGLLYMAAVVISLVPALFVTPGPERDVWVQFAAVLMAFGFYMAGLSLGASTALLRWLLAGLCVSVLAEAVVVIHDAFAPAMWFPDPMEGRVRGTFKANGQLGAFGFCAAALLVTFGTTLTAPRARKLFAVAAILAASFAFFASRRTGMFCVIAWCALFPILAYRFAGRPFYKLFIAGFLSLLTLAAVYWPRIEESFFASRLRAAASSLGNRESFFWDQHRDCLKTADRWFPFGFGVGRGETVDPRDGFEIHDTWMAVLVEFGVPGLAGFAGLVGYPLLRRRWHARSPDHALLGILMTTTLLLLCVFMLHNTLYRDRTFLLFLGSRRRSV